MGTEYGPDLTFNNKLTDCLLCATNKYCAKYSEDQRERYWGRKEDINK